MYFLSKNIYVLLNHYLAFPFLSFSIWVYLSFSQVHDQAEFLSFLSRTFKKDVDFTFVLSMVLKMQIALF